MSVKELARLYDSLPVVDDDDSSRRSSLSRPEGGSWTATSGSTLRGPSSSLASGSTLVPTPTPARFLRHHRPSSRLPVETERDPLSPDSLKDPFQESNENEDPFASELDDDVPALPSKSTRPGLPPRTSTLRFVEDAKAPLRQHIYPPESSPYNRPTLFSSRVESYATTSGTSTRSHIPIPTSTVFSRNAAPMHLPKLDNYLSALPKPEFLEEKKRDEAPDESSTGERDASKLKRRQGMFPPMDRLKGSGVSLEDLEFNNHIPPIWSDRKFLLRQAMNLAIGALGSSALASFYSLQGLVNTVQIFALILGTLVPLDVDNVWDKWRKLFLGTIPKVLALNFASTLVQSLLYLVVFLTITAFLLWYFYRSTLQCNRYNTVEGLQQTEFQGHQWGLVIVTFILTVIYLPLSTMAVHVIVWSEELWPVPNPYINATTFPPELDPLGPMTEFRDPLDFCWTTTMKRNEVNYAPILVILGIVSFLLLAVWFPLALRRVIQQSVPKVEKFSGMGRPRSNADMDAEYHRLLERDRNPFAFLYSAFRRGWGSYESTYLFAKLSTLLIIAVIDGNNCLFNNYSRTMIPVIRQIVLLLSTIAFWTVQCIYAPFLDPVNNASEWTSRLNYVSTATTALLVSLDVPGKKIIETYVLYTIYIITYGLGFYFVIINLDMTQRIVKRFTRRIDFSIDIFSPRLDTSPSSVHLKRRIWQESVSTILLTDPDCRIPTNQPMAFAQARDSEHSPYLLNFTGTPGERHAENMKILREIGDLSYRQAVALLNGPDYAWYKHLEEEIQNNFVGPDSYWCSPSTGSPVCKSYFGNAWWIPFPPTIIIRYDEGPTAIIEGVSNLEAYVAQNVDPEIQRRRQVRLSLRALEGQTVVWPYEHRQAIGSASWFKRRGNYQATASVSYRTAVFRIKRRGFLLWRGVHLGSGFEIELSYAKHVKQSRDIIGLNDECDLTPPLAKFLELNRGLIEQGTPKLEEALHSYRVYHRKESRWKIRVLSYRFLVHVWAQPRNPTDLPHSSIDIERDPRVRQAMLQCGGTFCVMYDRYLAVCRSEAAAWWYIFWDDLWRRNRETIAALRTYEEDFNPHYATSIAYTPLPRAALESFLTQRGLLHKKPKYFDCFHSGFLNKLYIRLNDCVYRDSHRAIMFHLGHDRHEYDMEDIDVLTQGNPSTLGTGGGTDHDVSWIRTRPTYRWEGLFMDPVRKRDWAQRKWFAKFGAWFGLTPLWRSGILTNGLSVDVRLENGKYVLLDDTSTVDTKSIGAEGQQ